MSVVYPIDSTSGSEIFPAVIQEVVHSLPVFSVHEVEQILLTYPPPLAGTYLLHRTPDESVLFACTRILHGKIGEPVRFAVDFFGYDLRRKQICRMECSTSRPAFREPYWDDLGSVYRSCGPLILLPDHCRNILERRGELARCHIVDNPVQADRAMLDLRSAPPGVFFIQSDLQPFSRYTICLKKNCDEILRIHISITCDGALMIWRGGDSTGPFPFWNALANYLHLTTPLNRWLEHRKTRPSSAPSELSLPEAPPSPVKFPEEGAPGADLSRVVRPVAEKSKIPEKTYDAIMDIEKKD
jgi:hypothetical protein